MTQIAETDATVTVTETTIGGMEFEPEMKVDKKGLLSLNKDHHQHLLTMLEIKDFPVPLIKDQVLLMLLFLLETQEINEYKKMSNWSGYGNQGTKGTIKDIKEQPKKVILCGNQGTFNFLHLQNFGSFRGTLVPWFP